MGGLKQYFFLIIFLLVFCHRSFGETLYLKSGNIVQGKILNKTSESLKLEIKNTGIVTYYLDEIDKIEDNPPSPPPKQYYDTGELYAEGNCINGQCKYYYKNGHLLLEGTFRDGEPYNGIYRRFDEHGNVYLEQEYKEGKLLDEIKEPLTGVVRTYYEDGTLATEESYQNGIRDGIYKSYDSWRDKTMLILECNYKQGKLDGSCKRHNTDKDMD